ncbi:hypothetical protein [Flavobacterium foetidum]|uniref:hypothetical protein n=1 Tax=Flavobacterium foetidum TaxID=2026681 RepID=UPI001074F0FE|nr:hypothetical protein [Flavobacterium foetidum]KAF2511901.1 hypothetical protein E0W73_16375 [Flavobacterium foetidum]
MRKVKLLLLFLILLAATKIFSQNKTSVINDFVKAVFIEDKSAQFIADHYIYFQSIKNTKVSHTERMKFFETLFLDFKNENSESLKKSDFQIVSYPDFKGEKIKFLHEPADAYVIAQNNKAIFYVCLKENKIFSFTYITKGEWAFFLTY